MIERKHKTLPAGFQLLPAIDLLGGMVVRLAEGIFDSQTVYAADPTEFARSFAAAGTRWIHIVDLDGARDGGRRQTAAGARGVEGAGESVACEVAGGLRDEAAVAAVLDAGAAGAGGGTAGRRHPA